VATVFSILAIDKLADFMLVTLLFYFHVCAGLTSIGSEWCTAMS
jgi:hypothetical protein